MEHHFFPTIK